MGKWYFTNRDDEGQPEEFYRIKDDIEKYIIDCIVKYKIDRLTNSGKFDPRYGKRQKYLYGCIYSKLGIYDDENEKKKVRPQINDKLEKLLSKGVIYRCWYQSKSKEDENNYPYWHTDFKRLEMTDYNYRGKYGDDVNYRKALEVSSEKDFDGHEIDEDYLDKEHDDK